MKNPLALRKNPLAAAEDVVRRHESALQKITEKIAAAEKQVGQHQAARRAALLDDPEADIPASIRRDIDAAQRLVAALIQDRTDLETGLQEAHAALVRERERGERETAAATLEATATGFDKAAAELHAAMASVAKSIDRLMSAIPEDMATYPANHETRPPGRNGSQFASPSEVAAAVLAEGLYAIAPQFFDETTDMIQTGFGWAPSHFRRIALHRIDLSDVPRAAFDVVRPGITALEAARAISEQWRERADRIRAGELIPDISMIATEWPKPDDPGRANVEVFATKPFAFVDRANGNRRLCGGKWVRNVPAAVADAAVAAGVALRTDTSEGRDAFEARKEYRKNSMTTVESGVSLEDCVDLGDVLGLTAQIAAE